MVYNNLSTQINNALFSKTVSLHVAKKRPAHSPKGHLHQKVHKQLKHIAKPAHASSKKKRAVKQVKKHQASHRTHAHKPHAKKVHHSAKKHIKAHKPHKTYKKRVVKKTSKPHAKKVHHAAKKHIKPHKPRIQHSTQTTSPITPPNKLRLVQIYNDTVQAINNGSYTVGATTAHIQKQAIATLQQQTALIHRPTAIASQGPHTTKIRVYEGDTIDITKQLMDAGLNPCALNMANAHHAGGGVAHGASAQEECLFRRSAYFKSLRIDQNPHLNSRVRGNYYVPDLGVIYSPQVPIIRDSKYNFIQPYNVSFIASAALDLGKIAQPANYEQIMKEKIRAILRASHGKGHDSVVLGAFGCGAFRNDPAVVSRFFREVLQELEFKGVFREVAFAIIDDHNAHGNLQTFRTVLNNLSQ